MKHGTPAGFQAGCRELCCRRAKKADRVERERLIRAGHVFTVPVDRSARKVHALRCMGWSISHVAERMGITQQSLSKTLSRPFIRSSTAARIDTVYTALELAIPEDSQYTRRTKNAAYREGHHPPLAWEDIDAGILAHDPVADGPWSADRFDPELVEYVMQYHDFDVRLTPAEKSEIVRRWTRSVGSEAALCRLTGWREGRYRVPTPTTQEEAS